MGLSESMQKGLNEQLAREFTAHFLDRAIAMDLFEKGYEGFAGWMDNHATEEYGHAERIIGYLRENNTRAILPAISPLPRMAEPPIYPGLSGRLPGFQAITGNLDLAVRFSSNTSYRKISRYYRTHHHLSSLGRPVTTCPTYPSYSFTRQPSTMVRFRASPSQLSLT